MTDKKALFDGWAPDYDRSVGHMADAELYPFAGHERVLDDICREAELAPGMNVLDLGTGTGNLAQRALSLGCRVCGTDLSPAMLEAARAKLAGATLVEADLRSAWPASIDGPFDRVVSAYVLHEFDLPTKISIVLRASQRLRPGGRIVIGDIAFPTRADMEGAHQRWKDRWDDTEHY